MSLPYLLYILYWVADVIAIFYQFGRCYCLMICGNVKTTIVACCNSWLPGVICQVADGIAPCYNSFLAGDICQVADGIATVGWMCMLDGISIGRWNRHGSIQFSLSSEVVNRTSPHICGRWNLPMFLLRDGLLTLINNASFIALMRFWSSLPTILKLSMVILWPVVLK